MKEAQANRHPQPTIADKLYFWLGGSLPRAFDGWTEDRIRSRWFPLQRMAPIAVTAVLLASVSRRSLSSVLLAASVPVLAGLFATFVLGDGIRRRALRRHQIQGAE